MTISVRTDREYRDLAFSMFANPMSGDIGKKTGAAAVKNALVSILKTNFGERLFAPEFGTGLRGLLFEQMNPITEQRMKKKIEEIEELNKDIQAILALFQLGIPDAGVYVLSIPTTSGGNEAIKEALSSAANGPPNSLDYSEGFMMMGGGPSMKPLQLLLGVE